MVANSVLGTATLYLQADASALGKAITEARSGVLNALERVGRDARLAGLTLTAGITAPIAGIGFAALKSQIDFESAFTDIRKNVEATDQQFSQLRDGILAMSKVIPSSAVEISNVAAQAAKLGIPAESLLQFSRVAIDLGNVTELAATQAAEGISKLEQVLGILPRDTDRVGSSLVALGRSGASSEQDILNMSLRLGGAGRVAGATATDILGLSNGLTSLGIGAEAGGTAFSQVFQRINQAVVEGGSKLESFAKTAGLIPNQFQELARTNPTEAILAFLRGLEQIRVAGGDVYKALKDVDLQNIRVRDSILRAAESVNFIQSQIQLANRSWSENTDLTTAAQRRYQTAAAQLTIFKNRLQDTAIVLGGALVPVLLTLLNILDGTLPFLQRAVQWFSNLGSGAQLAILGFVGLVAAIGPFAYTIGAVLTVITPLLVALRTMYTFQTFAQAALAATTAVQTANTVAVVSNAAAISARTGLVFSATAAAQINTAATTAQTAAVAAQTGVTLAGAAAFAGLTLGIFGLIAAVAGGIYVFGRLKKAMDEAKQSAAETSGAATLAQKLTLDQLQAGAESTQQTINTLQMAYDQLYYATGLGIAATSEQIKTMDRLQKEIASAKFSHDLFTDAIKQVRGAAESTDSVLKGVNATIAQSGIGSLNASGMISSLADEYDALSSSALAGKLAVALLNDEIGKSVNLTSVGAKALGGLTEEDAQALLRDQQARQQFIQTPQQVQQAAVDEVRQRALRDLERAKKQAELENAAGVPEIQAQIDRLLGRGRKSESEQYAGQREHELAKAVFGQLPGLSSAQEQIARIMNSSASDVQKVTQQFDVLDKLWTDQAIPALRALGLATDNTFRDEFDSAVKAAKDTSQFLQNRQSQVAQAVIQDLPGFGRLQKDLAATGKSGATHLDQLQTQFKLLDDFWKNVAIPGLVKAGVQLNDGVRSTFESLAEEILNGKNNVKDEIGGLSGIIAELATRRIALGLDPGRGMFRVAGSLLPNSQTTSNSMNVEHMVVNARPDAQGIVTVQNVMYGFKESFAEAVQRGG